MRGLIVALCWVLMVMSCAARDRNTDERYLPKAQSGCLQGSYLQLLDYHSRWSNPEWRALFDNLIELRVESIVIQWSAFDQRPFYRAAPVPSAPDMPLESIIRMADASAMRVMVGLSHDPAYWTRVGRPDKRVYLAERLRLNRQAANELRAIVVAHPSFAGWYISEEIDDVNWNAPADKLALFDYLKELSNHLRKLTPTARIGVSGFVNSRTDPHSLRDFWIDLFARAPAIDEVYFQDGVGVAKLTLAELPRYYSAMRDATTAAGRELVPVVEALRQTAGPPISKGEFKAEPTTLRRLGDQIGVANTYAARHVVFGVPEYLTPAGGAPAARLYQEYRDAMRASGQACKTSNGKYLFDNTRK